MAALEMAVSNEATSATSDLCAFCLCICYQKERWCNLSCAFGSSFCIPSLYPCLLDGDGSPAVNTAFIQLSTNLNSESTMNVFQHDQDKRQTTPLVT